MLMKMMIIMEKKYMTDFGPKASEYKKKWKIETEIDFSSST